MTGPFTPLTESHVDELRRIVGARNVVWGDPEKLEAYSHDETADPGYAAMPEAVIRPSSAEEIAEVMRLATRERIAVTPRGAGSGLSCGAVPVFGGIVLSVDRMNRILEIDPANMTATVQPGVVTSEIDAFANEHGLFFAGYPMSLETCFIGGNVAENAGGGKAVKYGVTGRYVLGLEAVLPTGEILRLGGKRVKDVTGYDLIHLLVGSEGTLAIFTEVTIKLLPMPKSGVSLLALFPSVQSAIDAVPAVMTRTGIIPTAVEFMDRASFTAACEYLNEPLPIADAGAMLLIELDGATPEQVASDYDAVGQLCLDEDGIEVYVADNHTTRERVWKIRRNVAEAFKVISPVQSLEDVVVPTAQIPELMPEVERIAAEHNVLLPTYGHAGDGNLHVTVVKKPETPDDQWHETLPATLGDLYRAVAALGGTISGEHGIGSKRRDYLDLVLSPATIDLMRRIKTAFDPAGILNPGKIF